ncbi:thioredoxin family protein [Myroides sp. M-43]|uniref:thioredoxin family protein n=1 Tax=Myroides oncorhynchi TaxID=2893756 RepID=UPI001E4ED146|nr:thioredoxin family protein [Myroides oncorhynchi]MCC9042639.1 thioredoxin family protein [Myroides oncorhynchi]
MINIDPKYIEKSLSYNEFRHYVTEALATDKSILNLEDDYLAYAELNEARLHRLDKTMKVEEEVIAKLAGLKKKYTWIVISESWCGDAAQIVPILNKMAESTDNIELRIVFRDQNLELMDAFLTNGGRAIPKLIIVEQDTLKVLGDWGPRPILAQKVVTDYKATHGVVDEAGKVALQMWYTKDKGHEVQKEVIELMTSFI